MENKYYGNYRAVVENNVDELEAGRVQVRIIGLHTDNLELLPVENLPWAEPAAPIYGGISGIGIFGLPCQGSHVFVFFEAGNIMQPRYFASAPLKRTSKPNTDPKVGFKDPDGEYPVPGRELCSDWNMGTGSDDIDTGNFIIETTHGHIIEMNSDGIRIQHGPVTNNEGEEEEGPSIELNSDGTIDLNGDFSQSMDNSSRNITGKDSKIVKLDSKTTVGGNYGLRVVDGIAQSCKKYTQYCTESYTLTSKSAIISATGGDIMLDSTADNSIVASNTINVVSKLLGVNIKAEKGMLKVDTLDTYMDSMGPTSIKSDTSIMAESMLTQVKGSSILQLTGSMIIIG